MEQKNAHVILFDGDCAFCSRVILYLIKMDKHDHFRFASLNSSFARRLLQKQAFIPNSVILYTDGICYFRSDAICMIGKELNLFGSLLSIYKLFPRRIRDFMYDLFAQHRYMFFRKQKHCILPSKEMREKILE